MRFDRHVQEESVHVVWVRGEEKNVQEVRLLRVHVDTESATSVYCV